MNKFKLTLIFSLTLVIASVLLLAGCSPKETTTTAPTTPPSTTTTSPFTEQELKQITADSVAAMQGIQTYKFDMDISTVTTVDDDDSQSGSMAVKAQAYFNAAQKQMAMTGEVTSTNAGSDPQTQDLELYVLTDYVYIGATIPEFGKQWIKVPVTDEVLASFDADVTKDIGVIEAPASVEFVEYATVRGVECYVIRIIPNADYLKDYAQKQVSGQYEVDWDKINNVSDIYNEISFLVSIAKDTKYVHRMDITASIVFDQDFTKSTSTDFQKIKADVDGNIEMFDYNTPVSIELPAEAEDAIEISPDMLTGQ